MNESDTGWRRMEVKLVKLFTEPRPGERRVKGKIMVRPTSPEQAESTQSWKQHVGMNGGGDSISIAYFEKQPTKATA